MKLGLLLARMVWELKLSGKCQDSRARVEVSKRKDDGEERVIRIEGEERMVAFAKHLVKMKIEAHKESLAENSDQESQDDSEDSDLKVAANVLARIGNI